MVKASKLIAWLQSHVGNGYVYGTTGQICTQALLNAKQQQYGTSMGADYYTKRCKRWLGSWVSDCSGLIKRGRQELGDPYVDVSAQGTYLQCGRRGAIGSMVKVPGCLLFIYDSAKSRMVHVGAYVGNGSVVEARGVDYGIVKTQLAKRSWTHWGLPDWIESDLAVENGVTQMGSVGSESDAGDASTPKPMDDLMNAAKPTIRRGSKGDAVRLLQQALMAKDQKLPTWGADGDFGAETEKALRIFQQSNGLVADGICGPKTWAALGV